MKIMIIEAKCDLIVIKKRCTSIYTSKDFDCEVEKFEIDMIQYASLRG